MPNIRVLTWNAFGGSTANLATAINSLNIDVTVLQETHNNGANAFYNPLNALGGYTVSGPFTENVTRQTPTGNNFYPDPSQRRSYAVVTRNATVGAVAAALVDYTTDGAYVIPNSAFNAGMQGFTYRPPLRVTFTHNGNACVIYNWHAPLIHQNARGIQLFDGCNTLANDVAGGNLVIIGADMNNNALPAHRFAAFDGLADGYDHLLAANTVGANPVVDLRTLAGVTAVQIGYLNALYSAPHWAVPARISY
ncbi:endonuclease/exonuclease/phosphatase family protein [Archangium lansingense]|uniref:Endonuclease/exonuclease/phosphatase domain-containing protein n=1 Tax=Archangium lansingense TaxID=2995310 RepID=A0ABT4A782_9BACT|nr:endonuclease/exonuclease/phosphatase family protein [Archangium lansinium]MCY1077521.1 hypothetical protein [Archangium lansinium]